VTETLKWQQSDRGDAVRVLFVDDEFIEFRSLKKTVATLT
jgi:hypothetical protein